MVFVSEPADVPFALFYTQSEPQALLHSAGITEADAAIVDAVARPRLTELSRQPSAEPLPQPVEASGNQWPEAVRCNGFILSSLF